MGKTILTPKQLEFLELAQSDPQLTRRFYLKHRLSEDIDLFCEKEEVNQKLVEAFIKKHSVRLKLKAIKGSQFLGLFSYKLLYRDGDELKVGFNYYPFPHKVHTLFIRARARDYVDLYFLLKDGKYLLSAEDAGAV